MAQVLPAPGTQTTFEYSSQPQAVGTKRRTKYRTADEEEDALALSKNIMYDRRVVRGNTYGATVVTQNAARELERLRSENERAVRSRRQPNRYNPPPAS